MLSTQVSILRPSLRTRVVFSYVPVQLLVPTGDRFVTPALLEHFHSASGGASIDTNEALVVANAALAAQVALALAAGPA